MRILISVLAMLVVCFLATQAKADLLGDLWESLDDDVFDDLSDDDTLENLGDGLLESIGLHDSDITSAPSTVFQVTKFSRLHRNLQSKPHYRAMAA